MKVRSQKARLSLVALLVIHAWIALALDVRTWTFSQDGIMHTPADGTVSFKRKGRLDAAFIRLETNDVVVLATRAGLVTLASTNLSEPDRLYVARAAGLDPAEVGPPHQSPLVRNEMSRRRREAGKLRDEATDRRHLAQIELEAAEQLDNQASLLANRAAEFQMRLRPPDPSVQLTNSPSDASATSAPAGLNPQNAAAIAEGAAHQLEEDISRLHQQAQEKRDRAAKLQKEAAALERTAQAEETISVTSPESPR